jgi:hypothetical protein
LIPAVGEHLAQEREPAEQRRDQQNAAIAVLDIGWMHDGVKHKADSGQCYTSHTHNYMYDGDKR